MPRPLRFALAIIAGIAVALAMLAAVEGFGVWAHPFPASFGRTHDEICVHVTRYPAWVLAAVVPMWAAASFVCTWVAGRLAEARLGAMVVAGLFSTGLGLNLGMLPYPAWFKLTAFPAIVLSAFLGTLLSRSRQLTRSLP